MTDALVVDLDGVLVLRDVAHREALERRAGLPSVPCSSSPSPTPSSAGFPTRSGVRTSPTAWPPGSGRPRDRSSRSGRADPPWWTGPSWNSSGGTVGGRNVALLTNSTDRLPGELAALGLAREFDAVFSSAQLGVAKPDPAVFQRVAEDLHADHIAFVDDSVANVEAAASLGWHTHHYRDHGALADFLTTMPRPERT